MCLEEGSGSVWVGLVSEGVDDYGEKEEGGGGSMDAAEHRGMALARPIIPYKDAPPKRGQP